MTQMPDLNNLIKALECEEWHQDICKKCEYGCLEDIGDYSVWGCDEFRIHEETLFWLKLYQYLIQEEGIKNG